MTPFGKDTVDMFPPKWASISAVLTDLADSIRHWTLFDHTSARPSLTGPCHRSSGRDVLSGLRMAAAQEDTAAA
jgi:hypothetical protein